ncbi:uncharacterized protein [Dysidea avara]|uniref:uncharacterized protein isoform X2 n=1 Tax=Dysidea avara TaxID=196820 RepID=UPI00331E89A1
METSLIEVGTHSSESPKRHIPLDEPKVRKALSMKLQVNEMKDKKRSLQQNLNNAKKQNESISVRFLKLFVTGSGAAGKTSFVNLLLKKKFSKDHHSTSVVHSSHRISIKVSAFQESHEKVMWTELSSDVKISLLQSVLLPTTITPPSSPPVERKNQTQINAPTSPTDTLNKCKTFMQETSFKRRVAGLFAKPVKYSNLHTFQNIVDSSIKSPTLFPQPGEVINVITLLDTGGQPQYIHLLPTINIYPTVTFVVHDLSKSLDDHVMVEYSQHGKHVFTPYHLSYSNRDMIKLLMSFANDSIERSPPIISHLVTTAATTNTSYICLVGTHADKVSQVHMINTANELAVTVRKTQCKAAVWQTEEGSVLFSVNNTTAGNDENEDPLANTIRDRIETLAAKKEVYELPITWVLLELEIQQVCSDAQKPYILFDDCVALARDTGLISDKEEVTSFLLCHHLLGVLIYFAEVPGLCNYVIIDHQWWFDKLNSIICLTFQQASCNHQAVQILKYQGLFSKSLLQHVDWKDDIKQEFFLDLLVHLNIIAPVGALERSIEGQYFIPFLLPAYSLQQCSDILKEYGCIQGQPLLIQFQSSLLPRGLFCSLIVELIHHSPKGWHLHFSHEETYHTFSNMVSFSLPDGYSLSLLDKVSYLEVQIRHFDDASHFSIHCHVKVYNHLVYALTEVCINLNFNHERLQYGFLCQCGKTTAEGHIAVLPETISSTTVYAECSINSVFRMKLNSSQLMWFFHESYPATAVDSPADVALQKDPSPGKVPDQPAIERPAMRLLHEVVIPRIAADWSLVADYLEYEVEDKKLIREKCHHNPLKCCVELLEDWLTSEKGVSPKSWSKFIKVLRQIKTLTSTTEKIVQDLVKAGVFV